MDYLGNFAVLCLCTYPAGFYYSNSVWERDHTKVERMNHVSTSAENGPTMARPAGPVPVAM